MVHAANCAVSDHLHSTCPFQQTVHALIRYFVLALWDMQLTWTDEECRNYYKKALDEGAVGNPTLKSFSLSIISGQLFCGHKPYQSTVRHSKYICGLDRVLPSGFMGGCGHIPHNLFGGFILLQKLLL